jgi:hypothetical protein
MCAQRATPPRSAPKTLMKGVIIKSFALPVLLMANKLKMHALQSNLQMKKLDSMQSTIGMEQFRNVPISLCFALSTLISSFIQWNIIHF